MKKNRFMKIAAVVFTFCLITTCGISTTLAKYTTGGSVTDQARVAKWGVHLEMQNDTAFNNEYATDDTDFSGSLSVKSSDDAKVVAPGTKGSSSFSISGTPEVAVEVTIDLTINSYVFLASRYDYLDPTTDLNANDQFVLTEEYNPVIFTLSQVADANGALATPVVLVSGTIQEVQAWLNLYNNDAIPGHSNEYSKNANLKSTFELSWAWNFEDDAIADKADTYLGNLINNENDQHLVEGTDYSTSVSYELKVTVTQID